MKNLTAYEKQVVEAIKGGDYFEDMPAQCLENIVMITGLSTKVLRGVLSSLFQKEIITEGEYPNGLTAYFLKN